MTVIWIFFYFIYPRLVIGEASNLEMPIDTEKIVSRKPVPSSQKMRKGQTANSENF